MLTLTRFVERLATAVERAEVLDRPAELGQALTSRVGPGPAKDLLSGSHVGHPLHPALVAVPLGAFTGALALDAWGDEPRAARRLVGLGLLSSVPAALTGLSDWDDTQGPERRVGVAHALCNSLGLVLLTASWFARRRPGKGRVLGAVGLGVMGLSGWLGGHLAYALGVGVDTTAFQRPATEWTDACAEQDLSDGKAYAVTVADTPVLLVRHAGAIRAIGNRCTHRGAPLHEGEVLDGCVECPWHGSRFALVDGAVARGPATRPAPAFETRVVDARVQVRRAEARTLRLNPTS